MQMRVERVDYSLGIELIMLFEELDIEIAENSFLSQP